MMKTTNLRKKVIFCYFFFDRSEPAFIWLPWSPVQNCAEILEYCKVLKLDPVAEKDLLFIAKEGIKAPLPKEWKPM